MTEQAAPRIRLREVCLDYPLPPRKVEGEPESFARVGGRLTEFRGRRFVRALDMINLEINDGERLALLGGNGSGKTTLLKVMGGLLPIARGKIETTGTIATIFNTAVGIDIELSGYDNLERLAALHCLPRSFAKEIRQDIEDFTELGGFLDLPVKIYSAGMRARLGFAFATALPADIILIDEVIGVGDSAFTQRARNRLVEHLKNSGIVVLASHSAAMLRSFCSKGLVLHRGKVSFYGDIDEAILHHTSTMQRIGSAGTASIEKAAKGEANPRAPLLPSVLPQPIEIPVDSGKSYELFVSSERSDGRKIKQDLAFRASMATFTFFDASGEPLEGGITGFNQTAAGQSYRYVMGARRPGIRRNTRIDLTAPRDAHRLRIALEPVTEKGQHFPYFEVREAAAGKDGSPAPHRVEIDRAVEELKNRDWQSAAASFAAMLAWPAHEIGHEDLLQLEIALMNVPATSFQDFRRMVSDVLRSSVSSPGGLTERLAEACCWMVGKAPVAPGREAHLLGLHEYLGTLGETLSRLAAPLLADGMLAMHKDDRKDAYSFFRQAAATESPDAPLAHMFCGAYSVQPYDSLLMWGEEVLLAAQSGNTLPEELEWLVPPADPAATDQLTLMLAGDAEAFKSEAAGTLKKLGEAGFHGSVHFHVVNWTADCSRLRDKLVDMAAQPLSLTTELYADKRDRAYSDIVGLFRAREIMDRLQSALVIAPMNVKIEGDPRELTAATGRADCGLRLNTGPAEIPWLTHTALPAVFRNTPAARLLLILAEAYVRRFYVADYPLTQFAPHLMVSDILDIAKKRGVAVDAARLSNAICRKAFSFASRPFYTPLL